MCVYWVIIDSLRLLMGSSCLLGVHHGGDVILLYVSVTEAAFDNSINIAKKKQQQQLLMETAKLRKTSNVAEANVIVVNIARREFTRITAHVLHFIIL